MTTAELIEELAAKLGNRTDITDERYVRWLNWSMLDIGGFHRQKLFPSVWFHELEDTILFTLAPLTGTVVAATGTTVTLDTTAVAQADYYNDTVIELTDYTGTAPDGLLGQERLILDYTLGRVATLGEAWTVNPDANTDYMVRRRVIRLGVDITEDATDDIYAILRLERANDGTEIEHVAVQELMHNDPFSVGDPTQYARHGNSIIFDAAPEESTSFRAWVYRYPAPLVASAPTVEPVFPEQWHEVILLGALWRGFESLMEPDRAKEAETMYVSAAVNRNTALSVENPFINRGFTLRKS